MREDVENIYIDDKLINYIVANCLGFMTFASVMNNSLVKGFIAELFDWNEYVEGIVIEVKYVSVFVSITSITPLFEVII